MSTKTIAIPLVYDVITKAKANFQYVEFVKRTTGEVRYMVYRVAGSDDRSGDTLPTNRVLEDIKKETLTVWDLNKSEYRRINLREVVRLVIDQVEYTVTEA